MAFICGSKPNGNSMLSRGFHAHGLFCASHPWEVIVFTLTLTLCILSMGTTFAGSNKFCGWNSNCTPNVTEFDRNADVVIMTMTRCMALLYIYHQFRNLRKLGSKYILGIAGLFTVFSSFVFSSSVINFLQGDLAELNEALPFFLLLIDLSKASLLAQFALASSSQKEVRDNIARGMAVLGPTITLDTLVETLVIGVGTLSGVKRLEVMCCFACLSVIVNYLVFMTFFPACLSLVLELSRDRDEAHPVWQLKSLTRVLHEEQQKPNPVLQRVKVIMSAGLVLVHAHSRWPLYAEYEGGLQPQSDNDSNGINVNPETAWWMSQFTRWLTVSPDQLVMLILALALSVKYIFFESTDEVAHMISTAEAEHAAYSRQESSVSTASTDTARTGMTMQSAADWKESGLYPDMKTMSTQTEHDDGEIATTLLKHVDELPQPPRPLDICTSILKQKGSRHLSDEEIVSLITARRIATYQLEKVLENPERAVAIRRQIVAAASKCPMGIQKLPFVNYDYSQVMGVCCENVIGYTPVPVGVAGPHLINGQQYYVPMATTEGCLVASTNRGCRALLKSGGVRACVVADGMTRGPVVRFPSAQRAGEVMIWLQKPENFSKLKSSFDSTSRYSRLQNVHVRVAGRYLFIRFQASTGDAMGMNMLSKGTEVALLSLQTICPDMEILSLSGNFCTDKKASAVNWIQGRGKSVVSEAIVPSQVVKEVLKTTVQALIDVNISKNLVGSAIAGSIGGFNAQAANIVTAIYIATGQDPAQCVGSSSCLTLMEPSGPSGEDLHISCTMPSLELGTIGGGTVLPAQASCLDLLGVRGSCSEEPGKHAMQLASIVCATVLAGELSLMSALAAGHLVRSHMQHNRLQTSDGAGETKECNSSRDLPNI